MMRKIIIVLFLMCLFLTACDQNIDIRFPSKQNWSIKNVSDFDNDFVKGVGGLAGSVIGSEFGINFPNELFNPKVVFPPILRLYERGLREMGIDFNWSITSNKLMFSLSGASFSQLTNGVSTDYIVIDSLGDNKYKLKIDYTFLGAEYYEINSLVYDTEVTVSAGKIISSNADKQTNSKAIWYNPSVIEVTFIPGTSNFAGLLGLGIGAFIVLLFLIKSVRNVSKKVNCPTCGKKVKIGETDCPHCGSWI